MAVRHFCNFHYVVPLMTTMYAKLMRISKLIMNAITSTFFIRFLWLMIVRNACDMSNKQQKIIGFFVIKETHNFHWATILHKQIRNMIRWC